MHVHVDISIVGRLIVSLVIGAAVGFERQMHGRPAGLRTHMLVCVGACLISMDDALTPSVQGKIAAQIVTGVGFLGAGTILRADRGQTVHGLTTAASIWATAGMGIAAGFGPPMIWYAGITCLIVLATLTAATFVERLPSLRGGYIGVTIEVQRGDDEGSAATAAALVALSSMGARVTAMAFGDDAAKPESRGLRLTVRLPGNKTTEELSARLATVPGFASVEWDS